MKIDLPHSEHNIRLIAKSPMGLIEKVLDPSHRCVEIEFPDGINEDEVEVMAWSIDDCGKTVSSHYLLKEAVKPEPEKENGEDDPVEADE